MYLLLLCTPGNGANFVRTMVAWCGLINVQQWKLPIDADVLIVDVPTVSVGRQLMRDLEGTLGLIDMRPLNFTDDVVALAPQLTMPCRIA